MKTYFSHPRTSPAKGTASRADTREDTVLKQACQEIRRANTIPDNLKTLLEKTFTKRFAEASKLVDQGKVLQVRFSPSHRTVWVVKGRTADYQVVPESMFCTCDDYYFRVMGRKKQLCYHLVAQLLAEALAKQEQTDMQDGDYAGFTSKWKPSQDSA